MSLYTSSNIVGFNSLPPTETAVYGSNPSRGVVHIPAGSAIRNGYYPTTTSPLVVGSSIDHNEHFREEAKLHLPLDVHRNIVRSETVVQNSNPIYRNRAGVPIQM